LSDDKTSLEHLFERIRADKSNKFAAGASLDAIREVEKALKLKFPLSLVKFWQEFDGGEFGFGRISSVADIGAGIEDAHSYNPVLKKWGYVPFGDTYGGDLLCFASFSAQKPQCEVIEWDHEAPLPEVEDDDDDEEFDGVVAKPYLNRHADFRALIADYYQNSYTAPLKGEPNAAPETLKMVMSTKEPSKPVAPAKPNLEPVSANAPFKCPHCSKSTFQCMWSMQLAPAADLDEEQIQLCRCEGCGFHGIAWCEKSRDGSVYRGFAVSGMYWKSCADWFKRCSQQDNNKCDCYSHQWLKQQGRFSELSQHAQWFDLERS
jgi:hypothetical protein